MWNYSPNFDLQKVLLFNYFLVYLDVKYWQLQLPIIEKQFVATAKIVPVGIFWRLSCVEYKNCHIYFSYLDVADWRMWFHRTLLSLDSLCEAIIWISADLWLKVHIFRSLKCHTREWHFSDLKICTFNRILAYDYLQVVKLTNNVDASVSPRCNNSLFWEGGCFAKPFW